MTHGLGGDSEHRDIVLSWCAKHKYWWVTDCPDCMVDSCKEDIKKAGRREVIEWLNNKPLFIVVTAIPSYTDVSESLRGNREYNSKLQEWGIAV